MTPAQVFAKLPANSPYVKQNISSGVRDVLKPQTIKVEIIAPIVEMRMAVVTCVRSMMLPMPMDPMAAATLRRMRGTVETALLNPKAFVYVGRSAYWCTRSVHVSMHSVQRHLQMDGTKNPKPCSMFPDCRIQKVLFVRKLKVTRTLVVAGTGKRGLIKVVSGRQTTKSKIVHMRSAVRKS
jgi:hypothetical protein